MYKSGQAGITKASVTVKFDNSDRANGPIGYEQYEEITVTRQVSVHNLIHGNSVFKKFLMFVIYFIIPLLFSFCEDNCWREE